MDTKSNQTPRLRLDERLVGLDHYPSRSRARDAIERGTVFVDGVVAGKAGAGVSSASAIAVNDPGRPYVSRAALKLIAGLDWFGFDPIGRRALDIGASTGGFTEVLLERGVGHVTAIDVGHGQMDVGLRNDPRVRVVEGLNARDLVSADLEGQAPDLLVCDVSFISLTLALPPALALAVDQARGLFLVKPQFEVGREGIGKGGKLRDPAAAEAVAQRLSLWLDRQRGWRSLGFTPSPIDGGEGAREFLLGGIKDR